MTRFLLDTSIVSAAMWRTPNPRVLEHLREQNGQCAIGSPVWHELQFGVRRMPRGRRRTAFEAFLEEVVRPTLPILDYDHKSAEWHAEERARLERSGKVAPFVDGQIAAIAVTNGMSLVTANVADFKIFKGLTVLNWTV